MIHLKYPAVRGISGIRIDQLKSIATKVSRGKYDFSKIDLLKEVAIPSVIIYSSVIALNIQNCIKTLKLKERQIDMVEKAIYSHPIIKDSPLRQLSGINDIELGYIVSAITSINHFSTPKKLAAYAGLDPKVRQSATWSAKTIKMFK